jgi:hypothetical protein
MSSIAKYNETFDFDNYENYIEYISDMEIYQILHPDAKNKVNFVVDKAGENIFTIRYRPPDK